MDIYKLCFVTVTLIFGAAHAGKHDIYSGYSVHGLKLRSISDKDLVHELELKLNLDVWKHGSPAKKDALVMVAPEYKETFLKEMNNNDIEHYLYLEDVARAFEEFDEELSKWRKTRSNRMVFQDYPRYNEIDEYLEQIAEQYPDLVTLVNAGPSFEGRDIKYLKISTTNFTDVSKPVYFLDAMVHAREWVTTPVTLYTIHRLVEDLREADRDVLDSTDWIILPIINPDGYEYSHTHERMWRRTRSFIPEISTTCYGVDGNRNYNASFSTIGVSSNPCSDIYPGPEAFSEIETQYVRDIMHEYLDRIQLYMDIHSYGNYITFGFGDYRLPSNVAHLHHVAATFGAVTDTYKLPQAEFYEIGNSALLMYATSGCAQDYGQTIGIPFSFTLELPEYGFDFRVPPAFIDQINEETWQGIAASARVSAAYYRQRYTARNGY